MLPPLCSPFISFARGLRRSVSALGLLVSFAAAQPPPAPTAKPVATADLVRRVGETVLAQTTRRLIDHRTGATYTDSRTLIPAPEISIESKFNAWFYQTWLLTDGMRRAAAVLPETPFAQYGEKNLDFFYQHLEFFARQRAAKMTAAPAGDGRLSPVGFHFQLTDLWHTGLAPLVAERFAATADQRYQPYLDRLLAYLDRADRLPDGTRHRARGRLMADDPYMSVPFLLRWWRHTGESRWLDLAVQQVLGTHTRLFHAETGLYRHGHHTATGTPLGEFWGRANGWMMLAHVELLAALPASHPRHAAVLDAFRRHAAGLQRCQSAAGGWHQLLDDPQSWIETSCTGMFVYGLARGVNEGWLPASAATAAQRGWAALTLKVTPEGDLNDVCGSTDIGDRAYYRQRPRLRGDLHGFGPFLLAGAELVRLARPPSLASSSGGHDADTDRRRGADR